MSVPTAPTLTAFAVAALLDQMLGGVAPTIPVTWYLGLTSGGTELSGNAYARKAVTKNQTNFPATSAKAIALAVAASFTAASGPWSDPDGFALYDASSGGNAWLSGALCDYPIPSVSLGDGTNKFLANAHGLTTNQVVRMTEALAGETAPSGPALGTNYFVISANTNDYQISATQGGSAVALGAGACLVAPWYGKTGISTGDVFQFPISGLKLKIATPALG